MSRSPVFSPEQFPTFGDLLKYLRRRAGLTQRELSIAVGYSVPQISRLEQNQRVPDQATLAARFAAALQIEKEPEVIARLLELAKAARQIEGPARAQAAGATGAGRRNLPIQLTSFIGRKREIAEVQRLLAATRLLTLTGAGGCGKTRLALQAAAGLPTEYPDGVWLVELASLGEPGLVPQAAATALDVREQPGRRLTDTLADYLGARQSLLVLDNCEHLIEACAVLAETLLRACPELRILATSREPLAIAGETVWLVPSLSLPDSRLASPGETELVSAVERSEAGRLFVERAMAAQRAFRMTPDNAPTVAQVCVRLDGIPLAIELAAARVRAMSVEQIAARLDDRFRLLTGGSRTALPRHQTLAALIDWSYNLLPEAERGLLRRLSVFRGGWTLEAAEAVCAGEGIEGLEVLDRLTRLVDKSLVGVEEQAGEARYSVLETVRQYAHDQALAAGEAARTRGLHLDYFLGLAEAAAWKPRGAATMALLNRLETEHDNLRAALEWAADSPTGAEPGLRLASSLVHVFWFMRGYLGEGREWLARVLAAPGAAARTALRAKALAQAGLLAHLQGDLVDGQALDEESLALCREIGDTLGLDFSPLDQKLAEPIQGRDARALPLPGLDRLSLPEAADKVHLVLTLGALAIGAYYQGDYEQAKALAWTALTLAQELGSLVHVAYSWGLAGWSALYQGDYERAVVWLTEALGPMREMGEMMGSADTLWALAYAARMQGDTAQAAILLREALTLSRETGYSWNIAACLDGLARVAGRQSQAKPLNLGLDEFRHAARLFGAAEALREVIGSPLIPVERADYEQCVAAVSAHLDEAAFAAAWAEGRAMTMEQAIEYALAEHDASDKVDRNARQ